MISLTKRRIRIFFAALLVLSVVSVGYGFASSRSDSTFESYLHGNNVDRNAQIAPKADGITVIATDSNSWRGGDDEGPRARAELVALNPNGTARYYNDTHTRYWDVDPVKGTKTTVEYSYADHHSANECPSADEWNASKYGVSQKMWDRYYKTHGKVGACTYDGVERVNLTTGKVTKIWGQLTPGKEATRYHDVDRIDENHIVVADIYLDGVFVVNTKTDRIEWRWNASDTFNHSNTGGPYPKDWSHINDVEVLDDGRIMVSVRNLDRVVFLSPKTHKVVGQQTLGEEDNYDTLYEQHNPDYINTSNGGPAAVVADSENNRLVEYQRTNTDWKQTWVWQDGRMQWPRDADRLPNGHTLVSDSNGNRVFELDKNGNIVWKLNIAFPYEAERLGTGDESANGPSAQSAHIDSRSGNLGDQFWIGVKRLIPGKYLNGLMYITPVWMGVPEVFATVFGALFALIWGGFEAGWYIRRRRSTTGKSSSDEPVNQD